MQGSRGAERILEIDTRCPLLAARLVVDAGTLAYAITLLITFRGANGAFDLVTMAVSGLSIISLALGWTTKRWGAAALVPFALWLMVIWVARPTFSDASSLTAWVTPIEALLLATVYLARARSGEAVAAPVLERYVAAVMLTLFGLVHLSQSAAITSLLPADFPMRSVVPYLTGALQLLFGLAIAVDARSAIWGAGLAALMFVSWIPLVHATRLNVMPSLAEWQFAILALCLSGALLDLAVRGANRARIGKVGLSNRSDPVDGTYIGKR